MYQLFLFILNKRCLYQLFLKQFEQVCYWYISTSIYQGFQRSGVSCRKPRFPTGNTLHI
jgi:hypothetical protein